MTDQTNPSSRMSARERERERTREIDWHGSTSIEISHSAEPKFRTWVKERTTRTTKPLYYEEARDGGAEVTGVSPKTTPSWIAKLVSPQGDFLLVHVIIEGKQRRQIVYKHSLLK